MVISQSETSISYCTSSLITSSHLQSVDVVVNPVVVVVTIVVALQDIV